MNKIYISAITVVFFLFHHQAYSATWEKLYVKKSTDCFRNVREVPAGGYILAGYTANFAQSDTDGLVIRMDNNGDTLWTFVYNGPSNKEDCFYKVVPTSDGGFVLCGYSRSFGNGDNAIYAKLNSSGNLQWIKNWGGSGIERAQDIIQLSDGKFVLCGYTTSSPAHYYDAFIMKIDQSGNTLWSKIYGGTAYDDANSLKVLPDDGFILGGQSNNDLFLIRTDANGDSLWTKTWGTSGIENIECVNFAQGGDGYILAGTTDGAGSGGEDGYLVKTDSGGVQVWAKTIGGNLNDGFHRVEQTSDGGYFCAGTSSEGPWNDPNIWISKYDSSGNLAWENFFGGSNHDHGYSGQPTSDGGYIACGHTHSFVNNNNNEDAYVIKTNSSGQVSNELTWTTVTQVLTPVTATCGVSNAQVKVEVTNYGIQTVTSIPITIVITGAITQTLTQTLSTSVAPGTLKNLTFNTTIDMSAGGTYNFHCYTGNPHDVYPAHNFLDKSITAISTSQPPTITTGTHCGPATVNLSASSPDPINWYSASTGGSSLGTGSSFTTPYITSNTTYYVQAGTTCPSSRVAVNATITSGITAPTVTDGSHCGTGPVVLNASSAAPIKWYDTSTSIALLFTGTSYTTPSLSSNSTYYVASDNGNCTSTRVAVHAVINALPPDPVAVPGSSCGSGSIILTATASNPLNWFNATTGGTQVGSGSTFTTPVISTTTTYYVQADDGICLSNRIAVVATVGVLPSPPVTTPGYRCGTGTVVLSASAIDSVTWFDAPTGGSQVGSGNTFTTPVISATTTFYALTINGSCTSSRISAVASINPLTPDPLTSSAARCGNGTVVLTATSSNQVTWFDAATGGTQVGSGNTFTTPVISATTIYYAQADNGQCPSNPVAVVALVNPLPSVNIGPDTIFSSASSYMLDAGPGFTAYYWSPFELSQTYIANSTGYYCVTVTDANNCSNSDCIFVNLPLGINENINSDNIMLYPDPSDGIVTVEFSNPHSQQNFSVLDITGKTVYNKLMISGKETFDLSFLKSGIYIVLLRNENATSVHRLLIE